MIDLTTDRSLYLDLLHQLGVTGHEGAKAEIANLRAAAGLTEPAAQAEPPQRKLLTVTTILNMMPSTIPADYDGELMEFARAVEATIWKQAKPFSPEAINTTQTAWKMGYEAAKAEQQQAEPVAWDKPSDSFNEWWDSDRRRDKANPFTTDSFSYWAFEGWQAALAQRPWVGLTGLEQKALMAMTPRDAVFETEAKLKEKNHG